MLSPPPPPTPLLPPPPPPQLHDDDTRFIPWPEPPLATAPPPRPSPLALSSALLIIIAVLSGSSGPTWFKLMGTAPLGVTKACWRMTVTALAQLPLALASLSRIPRAERRALLLSLARAALPIGAIMGVHFACVASAIGATSFEHAIIAVNCSPVFFPLAYAARHAVSVALARGGGGFLPLDAKPAGVVGSVNGASYFASYIHPSICAPLNMWEVGGVSSALVGLLAVVAGESGGAVAGEGDAPPPSSLVLAPTVYGDCLALAASAAMALYFAGGQLRGRVPLFAWMCALHATAAVATGTVALASGAPADASPAGVFGWATPGVAMVGAAGSAAFPSMLAHSIVNHLTGNGSIPPFVISVFMQMQPLSGLVLGYVLGFIGPPSLFSLCGGPLVIIGGFLATAGAAKRKVAEGG